MYADSKTGSATPRTKSATAGSGVTVDIELLKIIRSRFSAEHVDVVMALIPMARDARTHTMRLPKAAYRKGLFAALSHDSMHGKYPDCPYDARQLPNFMSGDNDPRDAWRDGSRDGLRIRDIVLRPEVTPVPGLQYREFEALDPELRGAHDRRESAE